ncbi:purine-binding chemotaxis protein CheW [Synergistales bacterium]|nr:purine-binding chemotaxis protein CheW [Synergistales bacterium]GHV50649.1 purine-binding chemotaxis protein CheW [Synergistales bacterium]
MSEAVAEAAKKRTEKSDNAAMENERTLLVFDLVGEHCGLDVSIVREIVHVPPRITRVPNAPHYVRGVINLRGTVIPVLDCALKMGSSYTDNTSESRIVVAELEGIQFGVLVDAVREVRTVADSLIEAADNSDKAKSGSIGTDYVTGVAKMEDGRLIVLLDLAALFEINELLEEEA